MRYLAATQGTGNSLYVRQIVSIKGGQTLQVLSRFKFRDVTKNHPLSASGPVIEDLIADGFHSADLFTTTGNWKLLIPKQAGKPASLKQSEASVTSPPSLDHDRTKSKHIPTDAPFLYALGVTGEDGRPRPGMASKLKQMRHVHESWLATRRWLCAHCYVLRCSHSALGLACWSWGWL
mmetsp:Transcript_2735/g.7728  ORF Transcript_2735/g.7728 Transcript_2735/m.7728 type:complete len:178 (+) Transcript_2735:583-1116(+)